MMTQTLTPNKASYVPLLGLINSYQTDQLNFKKILEDAKKLAPQNSSIKDVSAGLAKFDPRNFQISK